MKSFWLIVNWAAGVLFFVTGVSLLFPNPFLAIPAFLLAALFLPPVQTAIISKLGKPIPLKAKIVLALVLLFGLGMSVSINEKHKQQKITADKALQEQLRATEIKQKHIDEFNANRAEIIAEASNALSDGRYHEVVSIADSYVIADDSELNGLLDKAKAYLKQQENENRRTEILEKVNNTPHKEYKTYLKLYTELVELFPDDETYSQKLSFYEKMDIIIAQQEKNEAERKKLKSEQLATQKRIESESKKRVSERNAGKDPADPQYKEYKGSGDDIIAIEKPNERLPALLVVNGNQSKRHFAVTGYNQNRNRTGLLINTTDQYSGIVALDLPPSTNTKLLELSASGSWAIRLYPIGAAQRITVGTQLNGKGDNVIMIQGEASMATVSGNNSRRHFAITAYDRHGNRSGLLVNTTDLYSGRIMVPRNSLLLEVKATGDWIIMLN